MLNTKTVLLALLSVTTGSAAAIDSSAPIGESTCDQVDVDGSNENGFDGLNNVGGDGGSTCNQATGDLKITLPRMYPEQADHDPTTGRTYFSMLYDAQVAVWDSKTNKLEKTITVPGKSLNKALHASGVQVNSGNQTLSIMLNAGAAFDTQGKNTSGENNLVVWDLEKNTSKFMIDLSKSAEKHHSGFQDMEHDAVGNIFVMSTFGGGLYRVGIDDQKVEKWWGSEPGTPTPGLTGLAKFGEDTLVAADASERQLFLYSMKEEGKNQRTQVKLQGEGSKELTSDLDGVYLPPMHDQKCLLVSDNTNGTIVLRSDDKWKTAEVRGIIPNKLSTPVAPETKPGFTVATVQICSRIFAIIEWFEDGGKDNDGVALAGNREDFPQIDITDEVEKLCREEGKPKGKTEIHQEAKPDGKPEKNSNQS